MIVLPIRAISQSDQPTFGDNFLNLARLYQSGLPVAEGVAAGPPDIILQTVVKHLSTSAKEVFDQRLVVLKKTLSQIHLPEELRQELKGHKLFCFNNQIYGDETKLWLSLLESWLEEVRSVFWREGFGQGINQKLNPKLIFFLKEKDLFLVTAFYDPNLGEVLIDSSTNPHPKVLQEIDQLVLKANHKLLIPQIYNLLISDNRPKILSLKPFTQSLPPSKTPEIVLPKPEQKKLLKSAVKIFLNLSEGFTISKDIDGVLVEGERTENKEELTFKLAEAGLSFPGKPVIFRLPNLGGDEIEGIGRLNYQPGLIAESAKVLLFLRHKKELLNIEVGIPFPRSRDELLRLKRELASQKVNRKGTLKFWLEVGLPENFINLGEYFDVGLDGLIINLDVLQSCLLGYGSTGIKNGPVSLVYKRHVQTMIDFLRAPLKLAHKNNVPVISRGELNANPDVLDFLIEAGIYAVVANTVLEAENLPEQLAWSEKRMIIKRTT